MDFMSHEVMRGIFDDRCVFRRISFSFGLVGIIIRGDSSCWSLFLIRSTREYLFNLHFTFMMVIISQDHLMSHLIISFRCHHHLNHRYLHHCFFEEVFVGGKFS
jgi:hypothetical protein